MGKDKDTLLRGARLETIMVEALVNVFDQYDMDLTEENFEHFEILMNVLKLYNDRTGVYGQVWKNYGALNNLVRAATKVDRLMETWWHETGEVPPMHKDSLDDAFDAINFLVFFMRCAKDMNITGAPPRRPEPPERPWRMHIVEGRLVETRNDDAD